MRSNLFLPLVLGLLVFPVELSHAQLDASSKPAIPSVEEPSLGEIARKTRLHHAEAAAEGLNRAGFSKSWRNCKPAHVMRK